MAEAQEGLRQAAQVVLDYLVGQGAPDELDKAALQELQAAITPGSTDRSCLDIRALQSCGGAIEAQPLVKYRVGTPEDLDRLRQSLSVSITALIDGHSIGASQREDLLAYGRGVAAVTR